MSTSISTERISHHAEDIRSRWPASVINFVPLAGVPDMVWKVGPYKRGGMNSPEHAHHFADMDRTVDPKLPDGATLLEICDGMPQNVSV
jgi:hypothetical protein